MKIEFNQFYSREGLSVLQFVYGEPDELEYKSGPSTLRQGGLSITEVTESGSVNNILITNLTGSFVFFSDADILEGAKQNRALNTSIYLAPNTKTGVPVSCVEQGRWRYSKRNFDKSDFKVNPDLRRSKQKSVYDNLKKYKQPLSNQGEVWREVNTLNMKMGILSDTSDLSESYNKRHKELNDFTAYFKPDEKSNAVAIYYGKRLLGLDVFNRKDIFREYFPKLISASVNEVYYMQRGTEESMEIIAEKTQTLLEDFEFSHKDEYQTIGAGIDVRFEGKSTIGSQLKFEDKTVHLSLLEL